MIWFLKIWKRRLPGTEEESLHPNIDTTGTKES